LFSPAALALTGKLPCRLKLLLARIPRQSGITVGQCDLLPFGNTSTCSNDHNVAHEACIGIGETVVVENAAITQMPVDLRMVLVFLLRG
jgi:hypothetical protein